jgi:hypothetical protein
LQKNFEVKEEIILPLGLMLCLVAKFELRFDPGDDCQMVR